MLLVIFSFICFVVTVYGAFKIFKAIRANDTEGSNKWLVVIITFMAASWIVRFLHSLFQSDESDESNSKRKFYMLNEDHTFYEGTSPKANFKKGDIVQGYVSKGSFTLGKLIGAAQSPAIQEDYLFLLSAKLAIPTSKLRYPTETELQEIEGEIKKFMDNLK